MSNKVDEKVKFDAKNYRDNWIDPMLIFGVQEAVERSMDSGNAISLIDHKDFPNPRVSMDKDLVAEIMASDELERPIELYIDKEGDFIPIDGKTRLTAIAQYFVNCLKKKIEPTKFKRIQWVRVKGDDNNARFMAVRLNLSEQSRPLSEVEVALAIQRFLKSGYTLEQISSAFGKQGREGTQWVKKYTDIYNGNPELIKAFNAGKLDSNTAVAISRHVPFKEQATITIEAEEKLKEGKSGKEVRRDIGLRKGSRTTLSFSGAISIVEELLPDFITLLKRIEDKEFLEVSALKGLTTEDLATYLGEFAVLEQMRMLSKFLKIDSKTVKEQVVFMVENSNEETQASLPNIKFAKNSELMQSNTW